MPIVFEQTNTCTVWADDHIVQGVRPLIPRIASMTPGELKFWRVGVLILGLPALALITGLGVYFARRD